MFNGFTHVNLVPRNLDSFPNAFHMVKMLARVQSQGKHKVGKR
jgi:hypothetical protein